VPTAFIESVFRVMFDCPQHVFQVLTKRAQRMQEFCALRWGVFDGKQHDPAPNIWLGVSVEDQQRADERIPFLIETPAAVKFLSCEPLLGPIDFRKVPGFNRNNLSLWNWWVIIGGESGHKSRVCDVQWIRDIVARCRDARVPVFVKQLGAHVLPSDVADRLLDSKGGKMAEWPEDLQVREWPKATAHDHAL
jgi:protein gp37